MRQLQSKNDKDGVEIVSTDEHGFTSTNVTLPEPPLKLTKEKKDQVDLLVLQAEGKMTSNVNKCFVAK